MSKALKVLGVTTSYPLNVRSASGIFVQRLYSELAKLCELRVVTPAGDEQNSETRSLKVHPVRYAPRKFRKLAQQPGGIPVALKANPLLVLLVPLMVISMLIAVARRARNVDLIHANWAVSGVIAGLVGRFRGIRVVTTLRGADVSAGSRLSKLILAWAVTLSDEVVVVSQSMLALCLERFPDQRSRFHCVENGVDRFECEATARPSECLRLLSVGSLIPRKRIDVLIDALTAAPPGLELTVVGDGPLRNALQAQVAALQLQDRVCFLGEVAPDGLNQIYEAHDILVHCSESEGRPNAVLEALRAGLAVVLSDIPVHRELLQASAAGWTFDSGCPEALVQVLDGVLCDPQQLRQRQSMARSWADNCLPSWGQCASQYLQLFMATKA